MDEHVQVLLNQAQVEQCGGTRAPKTSWERPKKNRRLKPTNLNTDGQHREEAIAIGYYGYQLQLRKNITMIGGTPKKTMESEKGHTCRQKFAGVAMKRWKQFR